MRRIQPRTATAISLVATDVGNNRIQFDPFLVQLVRVVDSSNTEHCLEAISPTTDERELTSRHFDGGGEPATPLGQMMAALEVEDLTQLSHMIRLGDAGRPRNPSWIQVYRELVEWAALFKLVRKYEFGTDTLIVFDGLLRSKVSARDQFARYLQLLEESIQYGAETTAEAGETVQGDSRDRETWFGREQKIGWVITSPPYYGMYTYIPDQWLRWWFLGGPPAVDYSSAGQLHHTSPDAFAAELRSVWRNVASVCRPGAHLVVRFGGIHDRKADPLGILKASLEDSGWAMVRVQGAGSAAVGRRQALHFLEENQAPREEHDLWARLL